MSQRPPRPCSENPVSHVDRTNLPFVTLDPSSSTDLDQAFTIEAAGSDLILRYAIADVGFFVDPDGLIDAEAWKRGETIYLPDARIGLYPPTISEGAASLLPGGPRPAIMFVVRIDTNGKARLDGAERAVISSRAKLGYASVQPTDLPPPFYELARRIAVDEDGRGASRIDPPQQEVTALPDGNFALQFRPVSAAEVANAALSLAANMAIADVLYAHGSGLFRVMADPDKRAVRRIRQSAKALSIDWPEQESLRDLQRRLDPNVTADATLMLAIRRSGQRAEYAPYQNGVRPWHWAMAATYVHSTAPLRRLADRYNNEAVLAVVSGQPVADWVTSAFQRLPAVMAKADAKAAQVNAAAIELAEAVELRSRIGARFGGRITDIDDRGARVQLCDEAITTRVAPPPNAQVGDHIQLQLIQSDTVQRLTRFKVVMP